MNRISRFLIENYKTVEDAMRIIDEHGFRVLLVIDNDNKLCGTLSDGDIRRHILRSGDIKDSCSTAMNKSPKFFQNDQIDYVSAKRFIKEKKLWLIPIVDKDMRIVDILIDGSFHQEATYSLNCPVVIMAGGKGTRLAPYTDILPKALIPILNKTITEHIMDRFAIYSCKDFYLILNHKRTLIKSYFEEKEADYNLHFIDENEFLGTGGGLALLKGKVEQTFFLSNCDILLETDYSDILDFHKKNSNLLTMVCAKIKETIPYGKINISNDNKLISMEEKPEIEYLANTGFYIIEPEFLNYIEKDKFMHITDAIELAKENDENIGVFIVTKDKWLDMGQFEALQEMELFVRENYYNS